jgi:NRPS condensation-like uncharacterized protein
MMNASRADNVEDIYELSSLQQGILFHTLSEPDSWVYFEQVAFPILGGLNIAAFRRAWQKVVDRHSVLRTSFYWEELEKPLQVVHRRIEIPLHYEDWRVSAPSEQNSRLDAFLKRDRDRGFDLAQAPLLRVALLQIGESELQHVLSFHHLLMDGWSLQLVLQEVAAFYAKYCQGQELELEPTLPYGDYIAWLQEQDLAEAEAFWRRTLEDFRSPSSLSVTRNDFSFQDRENRYGEHTEILPAANAAALKAFAQQHRFTLSTLFQAAWALLLSRYSSEQDVVFGHVVSGRPANLWSGYSSTRFPSEPSCGPS